MRVVYDKMRPAGVGSIMSVGSWDGVSTAMRNPFVGALIAAGVTFGAGKVFKRKDAVKQSFWVGSLALIYGLIRK